MTSSHDPAFHPESSQVGQDWDRLARHLAGQGLVFDTTYPVRQFSGGFGNLNYLIRVDDDLTVLRRPPPGPLSPGANDMMREARILTGLADLFPLAPACRYRSDDTSVLGAPFLIMEYRPGLVVRGDLPDPHRQRPDIGDILSSMLIDVITTLHAVDPAAVGLDDLGQPNGFLMRTAQGWAQRADRAWDGNPPACVPEILAWLERHPAPEGRAALLHNDYKIDNMILDPTTLAPQALIDWDLGTRGDPLWDLAVLLSYWSEPDDPAAMHALGQMPSACPGFPRRRDMIERYARTSARPVEGIRHHRVLAQFRLAVVFRQIFRRYRDSGETNARAADFDGLADGLMDFTTDIMAGRSD